MPINPGMAPFEIDDDEGFAAPCQVAPDRPGKAHEVGDVTAIDQLRARDRALDDAGPENERVGASGALAPQADTAVLGMTLEDVLLGGIEARCRVLARVEDAHAAAAEQVFQHRHRDEDAVAIA